MPFPRKFKELLESSPPPEAPHYVVLCYAVCACERESCGWYGWTLEVVVHLTGETYGTLPGYKIVKANDNCRCPNCGRGMFRIEEVRFDRAPAEEPREGWVEGVDYEIAPMVYVDDDDHAAWEAEAKKLREAEEHRQYWAELDRQRLAENDKKE